MKNYNTILIKKQQKISPLSAGKIEKYKYLTCQEILPSSRRQILEQASFTYSSLGKALDRQTEKQVVSLKSLNLSNKTNELKQIEGIFPKNLLNDLVINKLKKIVQLQDINESNELDYSSKRGKTYNFSEYALPIVFLS